jgi:hypothetical protein
VKWLWIEENPRLFGCTILPGAIKELTENQAVANKETKATLTPVSPVLLASFETVGYSI